MLVVDGDEESRTRLLLCLRRLGLRALGVDLTADAVALLEALDADVALVHNDDADAALDPLRKRTVVVQLPRASARRRSGRPAPARARPPRRGRLAQLSRVVHRARRQAHNRRAMIFCAMPCSAGA